MSSSIIDVCKKAGVSRMTVSRVIRGSSSVSPQTKQLVIKTIQDLGYLPSTAARAMRSKDNLVAKGNLCCALVFGSDLQASESFFSVVAMAAEQEAAVNGLCLLQSHWQENFEASWHRLRSVCSVAGLCGIILAGKFGADEIAAIKKYVNNIVLVDAPLPTGADVISIESDNMSGCRQAIKHLIDRGTKRLLVLTGPSPDHYFCQAVTSTAEAFLSAFEDVRVVNTDLTTESGYKIVYELFRKELNFDGVFGNDELAIGALRAFSDLSIRVPQDVKVVGFDDIGHASFTVPSLTTVRIEKSQLGYEAVKSLVEILRGKSDVSQIKKVLKATLIVREST
ncbi:MAG: hypothetical protein A2Y12_05455 [Planctomycetes bacterium GWF2_42_9]|nr:MAG: hypothetical protein A2Y12_05455 [Planctomycetes bacterium GWF2_42_9]